MAIKELKVADLTEKGIEELKREAHIMRFPAMLQTDNNSILPHHANVLRFIAILDSPYCLVSEYCEKGSLYDWMMKTEYSESRIIQFALGIAKGMAHLHEHSVIHRDLATRNILVCN